MSNKGYYFALIAFENKICFLAKTKIILQFCRESHQYLSTMVSTSRLKYIRSLSQQKYRKAHNTYLAEGDKIVREYLSSESFLEYLIGTAEFLEHHQELIRRHPETEVIAAQSFELEKLSGLKTGTPALLTVRMPARLPFQPIAGKWALMSDAVQDPGNMGTIIRIADWFGIRQLICTPGCADVYNPKVVQSAMGSLLRVTICQEDPEVFFRSVHLPVYATALDGEDIRGAGTLTPGIIVLGNESRGVSPTILQHACRRLKIPGGGGAESLNVAIAAGIVCFALSG